MSSVVSVGTVGFLARYPVKSTSGESLATALVEPRGLAHDRRWAVYTADGGIGSGKTTRRFRKLDGLLGWRSTMSPDAPDDVATLRSPSGAAFRVDDPACSAALSDAFGQPLTLRSESTVSHYDDCAVHIVTTSSLRLAGALIDGTVDARRLRPNILLQTEGTSFLEDDWVGARLRLGPDVVLRLGEGMPRCVMVDQPQVGLPGGRPVLKTLGREHGTVLGLQAEVVTPGWVEIGHAAQVELT